MGVACLPAIRPLNAVFSGKGVSGGMAMPLVGVVARGISLRIGLAHPPFAPKPHCGWPCESSRMEYMDQLFFIVQLFDHLLISAARHLSMAVKKILFKAHQSIKLTLPNL